MPQTALEKEKVDVVQNCLCSKVYTDIYIKQERRLLILVALNIVLI